MSDCVVEANTLAVIAGKPLNEVPSDLFIPPDALEILLDSFSGPLDLLLYLIKRQNIDILDIPMALVTRQYMQYIHLMEEKRLELAADYLVMAALLAEIKSRMLLPPRLGLDSDEVEEDPRMLLVKRLQIYEQFKHAATQIDALPRYERDIFPIQLPYEPQSTVKIHPAVELATLTSLMQALLTRQNHLSAHLITREPLSVRARMNLILQRLGGGQVMELSAFLTRREGRSGLVVTFLAILELSRQALVVMMQSSEFAMIHIKVAAHD